MENISHFFLESDSALLRGTVLESPDRSEGESHLVLSVRDSRLSFKDQTQELLSLLDKAIAGNLDGYAPVFMRFFLSDALNQISELRPLLAMRSGPAAISIIQQPSLDLTKVALWVILKKGVSVSCPSEGTTEVLHRSFCEFYTVLDAPSGDSYQSTVHVLDGYTRILKSLGCTLEADCQRTWFFVDDIDRQYQGMVRARNEVFDREGLTGQTHFIASTGIGGRPVQPGSVLRMDAYALKGVKAGDVRYLYATDHLNRTSEYGVRFERGVSIDVDGWRSVMISGTASIDAHGAILYPGDVKGQTLRMLENVRVLLLEAQCGFEDLQSMIVYLRDPADYRTVREMLTERFPSTPCVIVLAPVCRPGWLIEMECMALCRPD